MSIEILFLSHRIPYPPNKGDKIRSHALLTHLARHGRVHLACFVDDPTDMQYTKTVQSLAGGECLFVSLNRITKWIRAATGLFTGQPITTAYFGSKAVTKWIGELAKNRPIGRVVVFSSAMAPYVLNNSQLDPSHALFDLVDIDSDKWRQYAATAWRPLRWIFRREASTLLRLEREAARQFRATTLVSPFEALSFSAMVPESKSRIFPLNNGVNLQYFSAGAHDNPFPPEEVSIVMTGRMDYHPNVDGARWFFDQVMPRLKGDLPGARFYIVGANPPASLRALAGSQLVVTGEVADVRPYIQHAAAVVAPLRIARGVQNKVLEAMAMEKPIVATVEATRALAVTSGVELWVENDAAAFAAAIVNAAKGTERLQVGRNARKYVELHHSWQKNLALIDDLLNDPHEQSALRNADPCGTDEPSNINSLVHLSTNIHSVVGGAS